MVQMFIKHVLGIGQDHIGLYSDTCTYYGTAMMFDLSSPPPSVNNVVTHPMRDKR
jgi:hypothetical protein